MLLKHNHERVSSLQLRNYYYDTYIKTHFSRTCGRAYGCINVNVCLKHSGVPNRGLMGRRINIVTFQGHIVFHE